MNATTLNGKGLISGFIDWKERSYIDKINRIVACIESVLVNGVASLYDKTPHSLINVDLMRVGSKRDILVTITNDTDRLSGEFIMLVGLFKSTKKEYMNTLAKGIHRLEPSIGKIKIKGVRFYDRSIQFKITYRKFRIKLPWK